MPAADPASFASPCTCFRIRRLGRVLSQRYDAALAPAGLNANQYSILRRAARTLQGIGALAAELGMDRSTLSRDLKHLAAAGWVRLAPGEDARSRLVEVTAAGRRRMQLALPLWQAVQAEIEAALGGSAAIARLHKQLDATAARLETAR